MDDAKNFAFGVIATAPSPSTTGTSFTLETGHGARFRDPNPPLVREYNVVVFPPTELPLDSNAEIVRVTAISGDVFTIVREQEGTTAQAIDVGWRVALTPTEKVMKDLTPVGEIKMFGGSTAPYGYLLCDGSAISRTDYADLFAVIGDDYGVGDGSTTFNIPDFQGRFPVGYDSGDASFDALGEIGGAKTINIEHNHSTDISHDHGSHDHDVDIQHSHGTHTHTQDSHNHGSGTTGGTAISTAEMASHRHNVYRVAAFAGGGGTGLNDTTSGTQVTAMTLTGSGSAHNHSISATTATNQTTTVSLGVTNKTTDTTGVSLGTTNKTSTNALSATQSILPPYLTVNFIIKY